MKSKIVGFLLFLLVSGSLSAQNREQLYQLGQRSFQDQLYSQAIGHFRDFMTQYPRDPRRDGALYMSAVSWYYLRNLPTALQTLQDLDEEYPLSPYSRRTGYWMGQIYYGQGSYEEGAAAFERQLEYPDEEYFYERSLIYLGLSMEKLGQWNQAEVWYLRMQQESQNQSLLVQAYFRCGLVQMQQQAYDRALEQFQALTLNFSSTPFARELPFYNGLCYFQMGHHDEADRRLRSYLQLNPNGNLRDQAWLYLAKNSNARGNLDQAREQLKELLAEFPHGRFSMGALNLLSSMALDQENWTEALDYLSEIYQTGPEEQRAQAAFTLAELYLKLERPDDATPLLEELTNGSSHLAPQALLLLAQQRRMQGNIDRAIGLYEQYWTNHRQEEGAAQAGRWLISLYQQLGDLEMANQWIDSMLEEFPQDQDRAQFLFIKADYHQSLGDNSTALDLYDRISEVFPGTEPAFRSVYRIGYIYAQRGEHIRASRYFEDLLNQEIPDDLMRDSHFSLALSQYYGERPNEALEYFISYSNRFPNDQRSAQVKEYLGDLYYREGRYEEAYQAFLASAQAYGDQRSAKPWYRQAICRFEEERWQEGRRILQDLYLHYPENSWALEGLYMSGVASRNIGNLEQAQVDLETAVEKTQGALKERCYYMLAQVLLDLDDEDQALILLTQIQAEYPQGELAPNLIYRQGDLAFSQDQYSEALEWYQLCRRQYPQNNLSEQALLRGALCRMENLDYTGAQADLLLYFEIYPEQVYASQAARSLADSIEEQKDPLRAEQLMAQLEGMTVPEDMRAMIYLAGVRIDAFTEDRQAWLENIFQDETMTPLIRSEALILLALEKEAQGDLEEAKELFRVMLSSDSGALGAEAQFSLARILSQEDPMAGAEAYMNVFYLYEDQAKWAAEGLYRAWQIYNSLDGEERKARIVADKLKEEFPLSEWVDLLED